MEDYENDIIELDKVKEDTLFDEDLTPSERVIENSQEIMIERLQENIQDEFNIEPEEDETEFLDTSDLMIEPQEQNQMYTQPNYKQPLEEEKPKKEKKPKVKKEFFWKKLSKKSKIIIICVASFVLLCILALVLYFCVFKKDNKDVIFENENYIYENGKLKLLSKNGNVIGTYNCKNKSEKKCYVAKLSNEDKFDGPIHLNNKNKKMVKYSKIYNNRFVFIQDGKKISLYDIEKKKAKGNYKLVKTGQKENNYVIFKKNNGDYGIYQVNKKSTSIILDDQEYLAMYKSINKLVSKKDGKSLLIDSDEKELSSLMEGDIKKFNDKYISVSDGGKYYLYNYTGENQLEGDIEFIDFYKDYVLKVEDNKLYIYDEDLNLLNESGIKLKNKYYNVTYFYDSKNKLKETKRAYKIRIEDGKIIVELSNHSEKTINIEESKVNKNFDYVSYSDGKLYFYSDPDKTSLIGTYKCSNENELDEESKSFDNCFIAKESKILTTSSNNGYSPIINGTYVFINDSSSTDEQEIVLFDIKNNSKKAKYKEIDTGVSASDITYVSIVNSLVAAKNTEGSYGVITFGTSGPSNVIPFRVTEGGGTYKTKSLKIFQNDYIIAKRDNKNYLYTKIGDLVASSKFTIVEYNNPYLMVKDKGYMLYKMSSDGESGSIISSELDYIKRYDNFFVGIKNNALNIYSYSSGKKPILEENVKLLTKDSSYNNFEVSTVGTGYEVSVKKSNGSFTTYEFDSEGKKVTNDEE